MIYSCCTPTRRTIISGQTAYNGIDFLDVVDDPSMPNDQRQRSLRVHFVNPLTPGQLTAANVRITGGERITNVKVTSVSYDLDPRVLVVNVDGPGDFSPYMLSLVDPADPTRPPSGIDLILSTVDFSFKAACKSNLDCQPTNVCPPTPPASADFTYLAKDFQSFRTLMLDRMATILPAWQEQHSADLGIMLIELLAFLGDYLSYHQDAVATEAYMNTARRRTSLRRHVRLIDYPMSDGRNARTCIHFEAADGSDGTVVPQGTQVLTSGSQPGPVLPLGTPIYAQALAENPQVFELMEPVTLYPTQNEIPFYTWGDEECCLPAGATTADLDGKYSNLTAGMVLVFQEVKGPNTGYPEDADPTHRWAVRLTNVGYLSDPLGGAFLSPPDSNPVDVTRITWSNDDALPFALCISSSGFDGVSAAFGNIALADHGRTISGEQLPMVPAPNPALTLPQPPSSDRCAPPELLNPKPARYNPELAHSPLTFADKLDPSASANAALQTRATENVLAQITSLVELPSNDEWSIQRDLLSSVAADKDFVAEVEDDGTATLRFGDGIFGEAPIAGTSFVAEYRIGNGTAGNVGHDALTRIATSDSSLLQSFQPPILSITNPLPAVGGLDPETMEQVRARAPFAFRTQLRAVTEQDYGDKAVVVDPGLTKALGTFRWTGSWRTVFISVDPSDSETVTDTRRQNIENGMELYRMAGHDVDVVAPIYVSLELCMKVCALPGYLASHVELALRQVLSNQTLPDGTKGVFHPDNFTFGQTVYLSPIYAAAQNTPGVQSVTITFFGRQGDCSSNAVSLGKLTINRLEIARLDNDPNFPEHGILKLCVLGGS
jgi:hypothetical protein